MSLSRLYLLLLLLPLTACDQIAALDGSKAREADGVAVGSACRQAGRAIEDCFTMNPDAPKASVFAGWKEMNDYMVQNKLDTVKPEIARPEPKEAGKDAGKKTGGPAAAADSHGAADGKPQVKTAIAIPEVSPFAPAPVTAPAAATGAPPVAPAVAPGMIPVAPAVAPGAAPPVAPAAAPPVAPMAPARTSGAIPVAPGSASLVIPSAPPVAIASPGAAPGAPAIAKSAPSSH